MIAESVAGIPDEGESDDNTRAAPRAETMVTAGRETAVHTVRRDVQRMLYDDPAGAERILAGLAGTIVETDPVLWMISVLRVPEALLFPRDRPTAGLPTLRELPDPDDEQIDAFLLLNMLVRRRAGRVEEAWEDAQALSERVAETVQDLEQTAVIRWQVGVTALLMDKPDRAVAELEQAVAAAARTPNPLLAAAVAATLAVGEALRGRPSRAEAALAKTDAVIAAGWFGDRVRASLLVARAMVLVDRLEEEALPAVAEAAAAGPGEIWSIVLLAHCRALFAAGDAAGVAELIVADAGDRHPTSPLARNIMRSQAVEASTARGIRLSREAISASSAAESPLLALARVRSLAADTSPALALGEAVELAARDDAAPSLKAEAMLSAGWAEMNISGVLDPASVRVASVLWSAERCWRVAVLAPPEIREALLTASGLDEAERLRLRTALARAAGVRRVTILTPKGRTILHELAGPETYPEIARRLGVSVNTIKTQVRSIYRLLGVAARGEAVLEASRRGLLDSM